MKVAPQEKKLDLLLDNEEMKTTDQLAVTQRLFAEEWSLKIVKTTLLQPLCQTSVVQNPYTEVIIELQECGTIQK